MSRYYKLDKDGKKSPLDVGSLKPPKGGSTYREKTPSFESLYTNGRGKQGGPTAKELADYERKQNAGIFTAEKGEPPQDADGGSVVKKAKGGSVGSVSKRADGIAQRGKTRGKVC